MTARGGIRDERVLPGWRSVLGRQLGVIGATGLIPLVLLLSGLLLLHVQRAQAWAARVELLAQRGRLPGRPFAPAILDLLPFLALVGLAWAFVVWHEEVGDRRRYHWSLPVSRPTHDLLRVLGGMLYLAAGLGVTALVGVALSVGEGSWDYWTYYTELGGWTGRFGVHWFAWPLATYLVATVFPVITNRPVEWLLGAVAVLLIVGTLIDMVPPSLPAVVWFDGAVRVITTWATGRPTDSWVRLHVAMIDFGLVAAAFGCVAVAVRRRP